MEFDHEILLQFLDFISFIEKLMDRQWPHLLQVFNLTIIKTFFTQLHNVGVMISHLLIVITGLSKWNNNYQLTYDVRFYLTILFDCT